MHGGCGSEAGGDEWADARGRDGEGYEREHRSFSAERLTAAHKSSTLSAGRR